MILRGASVLYGAAAAWRRRRYAGHPGRQRRLARPVVSVGNLSVGGSGKTPLVACIAQHLVARGERPAILTRGYARRVKTSGVTIVSDADGVRAGLDASGDEPLMLARALPGVPVVVGADRFAAGAVAERELGCTLHILDDGFQHVRLARAVDLLAVAADDLADHVLPAGRLRERLTAARSADAVLTPESGDRSMQMSRALGVGQIFTFTRSIGAPRLIGGGPLEAPGDHRVFLMAGIARPQRFFSDVVAAGWRVAGTLFFPDHHSYSAADVNVASAAARAAGATLILTTEKDAVRLEGMAEPELPIGVVPLRVTIEAAFFPWLAARLSAARRSPDDRAESAAPA